MAYHGRSPEEAELAGEEMGFSLGDIWKKVVSFARTPEGAAVSTIFLPAPVAAALAASGAARKAQGQGAGAGGPVPGRAAAASGRRGPSAPSAPDQTPASASASAPAPESTSSAGWYTRRALMGAEPPMSDADVMGLIKREKDPRKRDRMLDNFKRAQQRRGW